jgi:hypothetical protein
MHLLRTLTERLGGHRADEILQMSARLLAVAFLSVLTVVRRSPKPDRD